MSSKSEIVIDHRHLDDATKTEMISRRIKAQAGKSQFASATFIKKDGTLRTLNMQRSTEADDILGTERGKKASETFARNHPHKHKVKEHKKGWRQINAEKVFRTRFNGVTEIWRSLDVR